MIFLGDLSVPDKEHLSLLLNDLDLSKIIKNETVILNLEGVLLPEIPSDCFWKVYNCKEVLELRKHCKKLIVSLANNHLYDFPEGIQPMTKMLEDNDIDYFGLYENNQIKPYEFSVERIQYAVFGHCWNIYTKSNPNKKTSDRVVDCTYQELYNTIKEYINKNPETRVICFPHWNFDLEEYPFPAHKRFSRDLIDAGAEIVVGNHAHCMQEAELYKGKVIAYGLGNLYMPSGVFFNGKLCFPEISNKMCAIKIKETNGAHTVYDFFSGSGSCGIASIITKRNFVGCELDKEMYEKSLNWLNNLDLDRAKEFVNKRIKYKKDPIDDSKYITDLNEIRKYESKKSPILKGGFFKDLGNKNGS